MDYFVPSPGERFQPDVFKLAGAMPARQIVWYDLLYELFFSAWEIALPKGWILTPFRYMLFGYGSVGIVYTEELGWIYGEYGVERVGWQMDPILFSVANHLLPKPAKGIKGVNGAILHVRDSYRGFDPLVKQYAALLADCDKALSKSVRQSKLGKILGVADKKEAQTIRQALTESEDGELMTFVSKNLMGPDGRLNVSNILGDLGRSYEGDKLLETRLAIIKDFLTRVGVRNVAMEKREHLLNQEIDENNDETGASPYVIQTCLKDDLKLLNDMGLKISIKARYDYSGAGIQKEKEGDKNGKQDAAGNGN